jgi:hypothetical protein
MGSGPLFFAFERASAIATIGLSLERANASHQPDAWVRTTAILGEGMMHYDGAGAASRLTLMRSEEVEDDHTLGLFVAALINGTMMLVQRDQGPDLFSHLQIQIDSPAANSQVDRWRLRRRRASDR